MRPQLKSVELKSGDMLFAGRTVANDHLQCWVCWSRTPQEEDAAAARKLATWLKNNRGEVTAMNRSCDECQACPIGCFTLAYRELGEQLDNLHEGLEKLHSIFSAEVMITLTYYNKEYCFTGHYTPIYGGQVIREAEWWLHTGVGEKHARAATRLGCVQKAAVKYLDQALPDPGLTILEFRLGSGALLTSLQDVVICVAGE